MPCERRVNDCCAWRPEVKKGHALSQRACMEASTPLHRVANARVYMIGLQDSFIITYIHLYYLTLFSPLLHLPLNPPFVPYSTHLFLTPFPLNYNYTPLSHFPPTSSMPPILFLSVYFFQLSLFFLSCSLPISTLLLLCDIGICTYNCHFLPHQIRPEESSTAEILSSCKSGITGYFCIPYPINRK